MEEGYYWILHDGAIQIAYYTPEVVYDFESGKHVLGIWHLTRRDDICHNSETEVLDGPIALPR
ncbi:hypothetical protein [Atlantibacter subterraneus]|uniref:hypothetical protein n=1 Tax=Atlantibacter subterraneus TaxID=255519 RepID=UPI0022EB93C2|nr:hypothetical protein [Atlantibacter subterranea]MDA3133588.1 hypothetical protein [Atlantibacter subterranea]